jgi:hypothetical protein
MAIKLPPVQVHRSAGKGLTQTIETGLRKKPGFFYFIFLSAGHVRLCTQCLALANLLGFGDLLGKTRLGLAKRYSRSVYKKATRRWLFLQQFNHEKSERNIHTNVVAVVVLLIIA